MGRRAKITIGILISIVLLLGIVYLYMSSGEGVDNEKGQWLTEYLVAHRGLFDDEHPENSLGAFARAIEMGYAIELDVLLSKDEEVMVFHDLNLERLTGDSRDINEVESSELKAMRINNTEYLIPTMKEVLEFVDGQVPILIEIKNVKDINLLGERLYEVIKDYEGDISVQSFNPFVLSWYKENAPEILRGQFSGGLKEDETIKWYEKFLLTHLMVNFKSRPNYVGYAVDELDYFRLSSLRKSGIPVIAWTVNDSSKLEEALDKSDSIIFDSIDELF